MLCFPFKSIRWKCWKLTLSWLRCAKLILKYLSYIFHTLLIILQLKNKFVVVSYDFLYSSHKILPIYTPFYIKFTLGGILSKSTLHPNCCALRVFKLKKDLKHYFSPTMLCYDMLYENIPLSSSLETHVSFYQWNWHPSIPLSPSNPYIIYTPPL